MSSTHKFATYKGKRKVVTSDHNPMLATFNINYTRVKEYKKRHEIYNFKDTDGQVKFFEATEHNTKFLDSVIKPVNLEQKCNGFLTVLEETFKKCFTKMRVRDSKSQAVTKETEVNKFMIKKFECTKLLPSVTCRLAKEIIENEIEKLDTRITTLCAEQNKRRVSEALEILNEKDGHFNQLSLWKLKRKLMIPFFDPPMGKVDNNGTLVTAPNLLKDLYLKTYTHRLRNRKINPELLDLQTFKSELWEMKLKQSEAKQTHDWTEDDIDSVLKSLKTNKARDPHGLVNEIFKPGVMGKGMKIALLRLFNLIKLEQKVPKYFQYANITTIYKNKGSRQNLENDRGIFVVSTLRMILDTLIYREKYPLVDRNMSSCNIGARKARNIRDHLFILYGVINSVINGNSDSVDIQIYDIEKCFDALWLQDCMLDLVDTLPDNANDDKVALIYRLNQNNFVAIKTPHGLTKRVNLENIVMQGGKWGPLKCSNSVDKIGKKCAENEHYYHYKNRVRVGPLAMVDDLLAITLCGGQAAQMNTLICSEIEMKKLRLHTSTEGKSKCHVLHIGKKKISCHPLKVHGVPMQQVDHDTYLGDLVSSDGKNTRNIDCRVSKGIGIISQIFDIMQKVNFGFHYFSIALSLRQAMLINGILTNCEIWYGVTEKEILKLEEIDNIFFRKLFRVPASCPKEALYLETGSIPIGIIVKMRRVTYLHHILTRSKDEMLSKFFYAQWYDPVKGDWTKQIKNDLCDLNIDDDISKIKNYSAFRFKNIVKQKGRQLALNRLCEKKERHSKLENLTYVELNIREYLCNQNISVNQARIIFRSRTRMTHYWNNFKHWRYSQKCPVCKETNSIDTQEHSFNCEIVRKAIHIEGKFSEVFYRSNSQLAKTLENIEKFRENYL